MPQEKIVRYRHALVGAKYRSFINHHNGFTSSSCVIVRVVCSSKKNCSWFTHHPQPDGDHKRPTTATPGFKAFTMALLDLLLAHICISHHSIKSTHSIHSFIPVQSNLCYKLFTLFLH